MGWKEGAGNGVGREGRRGVDTFKMRRRMLGVDRNYNIYNPYLRLKMAPPFKGAHAPTVEIFPEKAGEGREWGVWRERKGMEGEGGWEER